MRALFFAFTVSVLSGVNLAAADKPVPLEVHQTQANLDFWLDNMIHHHGYSDDGAALVAGIDPSRIDAWVVEHPTTMRAESANVKILPYPGGRHPRIGFLEGAIDPQRGTKASVFLPWEDAGYVVIDLPEAIFSNLGLTYLAHTHVPTIWEASGVAIPNIDWTLHDDGSLSFERELPNGIVFGSKIAPASRGADCTMWLVNGTDKPLSGLRTQVCVMLKGAPDFNDQSKERRVVDPPVTAVRSKQGNRWVLVAFDRCGRGWANPPVPCIHSDPWFEDLAPGGRSELQGRLWFYEGEDIEGEIRAAKKRWSVLEKK